MSHHGLDGKKYCKQGFACKFLYDPKGCKFEHKLQQKLFAEYAIRYVDAAGIEDFCKYWKGCEDEIRKGKIDTIDVLMDTYSKKESEKYNKSREHLIGKIETDVNGYKHIYIRGKDGSIDSVSCDDDGDFIPPLHKDMKRELDELKYPVAVEGYDDCSRNYLIVDGSNFQWGKSDTFLVEKKTVSSFKEFCKMTLDPKYSPTLGGRYFFHRICNEKDTTVIRFYWRWRDC
jgi:hypothetical protein